jgi:hypothetical protein
VYVAVLNDGIGREQEWAHLKRLPGHADLALDRLNGNFLRLRCDGFTVKWERHTEFTRYSIVQALPAHAGLGATSPELASHVVTGTDWLRNLPGKTVAAVHLGMLIAEPNEPNPVALAQAWLGEGSVVGSRMGNTTEGVPHSSVLTHFRMGEDGFERILVLAPADTSEARAGRILVVLELSGGNDGMNTIVPYGDDAYYKLRPTIGIRQKALRPLDDQWLGIQVLWQLRQPLLRHQLFCPRFVLNP